MTVVGLDADDLDDLIQGRTDLRSALAAETGLSRLGPTLGDQGDE